MLFRARLFLQGRDIKIMRMLLFSFVVAAGLFAGGCVLHFKAEGLEMDAERQRIQNDVQYRFESVSLLHGIDS